MPNWCINTIDFEDNQAFKDFIKDVGTISENEDPTILTIDINKLTDIKGVSDKYPVVYPRCAVIDLHSTQHEDGVTFSSAYIETAWGYPDTSLDAMFSCAGLTAMVYSEEPGMGVYEVREYQDGELVSYTDYYPIRDKHAKRYSVKLLKDVRKEIFNWKTNVNVSALSAKLSRLIKVTKKLSNSLVSPWDIEEGSALQYLLTMKKFTDEEKSLLEDVVAGVSREHYDNGEIPDFAEWHELK